VIAHFGVQVEVEAQDGELPARCSAATCAPTCRRWSPATVVWRAGNQGIGVIVAQLPRSTELCRPDSRGQLKPVAANVDMIVIVFAPLPEPHANLIDRYLVAAEHAGIRPLLLLNKFDLIDDRTPRRSTPAGGLPHAGLPGAGSLGAPRQWHGTAATAAGRAHQRVRRPVRRGQVVAGQQPAAGSRTRVGPLSELSGQGTHTTTTARCSTSRAAAS
jgi:ribosome biogenesis GTPase